MKVGILTSGGDAPGINATIRGVGKTVINNYGMQVIGILNGFSGLLHKDIVELTDPSLSGILNMGGTILGTAREKVFRKMITSPDEKDREQIKKMPITSWGSIVWYALEETAPNEQHGCFRSLD